MVEYNGMSRLTDRSELSTRRDQSEQDLAGADNPNPNPRGSGRQRPPSNIMPSSCLVSHASCSLCHTSCLIRLILHVPHVVCASCLVPCVPHALMCLVLLMPCFVPCAPYASCFVLRRFESRLTHCIRLLRIPPTANGLIKQV